MTADTMDYLGIGRARFALDPDVFQWPPLFWFLLQCARGAGLGAWTAATVVMCIARAVLASGASRLGSRLAGPFAGHAFALATFVWTPLTYAGLYCLSDVLFLGCLAWWLGSAVDVRGDAPDLTRRLWRTTLCATLMVSTRFVGAPLALVEWLYGALALRHAKRARWWRTALLSGACIVGPALCWMALGRITSGQAVGERHPSRYAAHVHLQFIGSAWWDPLAAGRYGDVFWGDQGGAGPPAAWLQAAAYACVLVLGWWAVQPRRAGPPGWRLRLCAAAVLYTLLVLAVSMRVWIDPIGPRFMLPVVVLAAAGAFHRSRDVVSTPWFVRGLAFLLGPWFLDCALAGQPAARFGSPLLAGIAFAGAGICLLGAWLTPHTSQTRPRWRGPVLACASVILVTQCMWSAGLLERVRAGALPSIQHPGWRLKPGVQLLRDAVERGDIIYTHTEDAVRAVLEDRRDVQVEPFCIRLLSFECDATIEEYVDALNGRTRGRAEWIVLCERVFLPYLFLDDLRELAAASAGVERHEAETVHAFRWPPTSAAE